MGLLIFATMSNVGSLSYPAQCSSIKKGGYVVIKEHPCKVVETSTSKTGKHGHAKVHMVGIDIFTGKKCEEICPSTHNMQVPNVTRTEFLLLDISDDDYLSLFMPDGSTKDDLKLPSVNWENKSELLLMMEKNSWSAFSTLWDMKKPNPSRRATTKYFSYST